MFGYFGGISLSVMVAKEIPIIVEEIETDHDLEYLANAKGYLKKEDLNLSSSMTAKRIMHVITPSFPHMNSTYNISDSQLKIIENNISDAFKTTRLILFNELEWEDLFLEYPFFHDFDHFIEIEIISKDEMNFHKWKGLIQARLRYLITSIEREIEDKVMAQLYPQEFDLYISTQPEYKF